MSLHQQLFEDIRASDNHIDINYGHYSSAKNLMYSAISKSSKLSQQNKLNLVNDIEAKIPYGLSDEKFDIYTRPGDRSQKQKRINEWLQKEKEPKYSYYNNDVGRTMDLFELTLASGGGISAGAAGITGLVYMLHKLNVTSNPGVIVRGIDALYKVYRGDDRKFTDGIVQGLEAINGVLDEEHKIDLKNLHTENKYIDETAVLRAFQLFRDKFSFAAKLSKRGDANMKEINIMMNKKSETVAQDLKQVNEKMRYLQSFLPRENKYEMRTFDSCSDYVQALITIIEEITAGENNAHQKLKEIVVYADPNAQLNNVQLNNVQLNNVQLIDTVKKTVEGVTDSIRGIRSLEGEESKKSIVELSRQLASDYKSLKKKQKGVETLKDMLTQNQQLPEKIEGLPFMPQLLSNWVEVKINRIMKEKSETVAQDLKQVRQQMRDLRSFLWENKYEMRTLGESVSCSKYVQALITIIKEITDGENNAHKKLKEIVEYAYPKGEESKKSIVELSRQLASDYKSLKKTHEGVETLKRMLTLNQLPEQIEGLPLMPQLLSNWVEGLPFIQQKADEATAQLKREKTKLEEDKKKLTRSLGEKEEERDRGREDKNKLVSENKELKERLERLERLVSENKELKERLVSEKEKLEKSESEKETLRKSLEEFNQNKSEEDKKNSKEDKKNSKEDKRLKEIVKENNKLIEAQAETIREQGKVIQNVREQNLTNVKCVLNQRYDDVNNICKNVEGFYTNYVKSWENKEFKGSESPEDIISIISSFTKELLSKCKIKGVKRPNEAPDKSTIKKTNINK